MPRCVALRRLFFIIGLAGILPAGAALAVVLTEARLVVDLAPGDFGSSLAGPQVAFGDRLLLTSYDRSLGVELFSSDGAAGTSLVADICPGPCSGRPEHFQKAGDRLLFVGETAFFGFRHGIFADTGDSVQPLRSTASIAASASTGELAYFLEGRWLLRSDGTPAGTRPAAEICPAGCDRLPLELFPSGGALYYVANHFLHRLDDGLPPVALAAMESPSGNFFDLGGGTFVFRGCPTESTCGLWRSDGTSAGTRAIFSPAVAGYELGNFVFWQGLLYFVDGDANLMHSDLSAAGTGPASELAGGSRGRLLGVAGAAGDVLLYLAMAPDGSSTLWARRAGGANVQLRIGRFETIGRVGPYLLLRDEHSELWSSDGTAERTTRLHQLSASGIAVPFGNRVALTAQPPNGDFGLWISDGTTAGTYQVEQPKRPRSSYPKSYRVGDQLIAATDADDGYPQFHRIDAQIPAWRSSDPRPIRPVHGNGRGLYGNPISEDNLIAFSADGEQTLPVALAAPSQASAADSHFFFTTGEPGQELFETDGSAAGTRELFDLLPGWLRPTCFLPCPYIDQPSLITVSGDQVYFVANPSALPAGFELWVYHRTSGLAHFLATSPQEAFAITPFSAGRIVFGRRSTEQGPSELWISDGTTAGTRPIFTPLEDQGEVVALERVGERVFFVLRRGDDYRLWVSDTTAQGTFSLAGPFDKIEELEAVGDQLFLSAIDPAAGAELWRSDGTPQGTRALELRPGFLSSEPRYLRAVDGRRLVFAADDGVIGYEPFLSDGTAAGTLALADLRPGPAPSSPSAFETVGERLFFAADDGASGQELWAIDLPAGRPGCPAEKLCLRDGRFEVEVEVRSGDTRLAGRRVFASAESGIFSFFAADNWEFMVKVLDGCGINDHFWVYAAAASDVAYQLEVVDRADGSRRRYSHEAGSPARPILDALAFAGCAAPPPPSLYALAEPPAAAARRCPDDPEALCLGSDGRFRVAASFTAPDFSGRAQPIPYGSADSGLFTFFSPSNWELMVKVLDGCAINEHHWVYAAGTTDVGFTLEIEDRATGERKTYHSPPGQPAITLTDSTAFGGCF